MECINVSDLNMSARSAGAERSVTELGTLEPRPRWTSLNAGRVDRASKEEATRRGGTS